MMGAGSPSDRIPGDEMTSDCLEITCPTCAFSRSHPVKNFQLKPVRATYPKCGNSLSFDRHLGIQAPPAEISEDLIIRVDHARTRRQGQSDTEEIYCNIAGQHVQFQSMNKFALESNTASLTTL